MKKDINNQENINIDIFLRERFLVNWKKGSMIAAIMAVLFCMASITVAAETQLSMQPLKVRELSVAGKTLPNVMPRFVYDSGRDFKYPDAVRGIYVTGHTAGGTRFDQLVDMVDSTDLNAMVIDAMVIDIKDDWGDITYKLPKDSPKRRLGRYYI